MGGRVAGVLCLWSVMMVCLPSGLLLICSGFGLGGLGYGGFGFLVGLGWVCCYNIVSYVWLGWFWCCARTCG